MEQNLPKQSESSGLSFEQAMNNGSFRIILRKIREWYPVLKPRFLFMMIVSLIFGLFSLIITSNYWKTQYKASYRIFLQQETTGLSNAMRVASSIGIPLSSNSQSIESGVQNYMVSRANIINTLLDTNYEIRLIERYFSDIKQVANPEFKKQYNAKFELDKRYTDSLLVITHRDLLENNVLISFDEKSHFIDLEVISTNESFSFDLANALVERTENHFFNLRRGKAQKAVNSFEYKVDSLKTEIDETLRELALNSDMGNALIYSIDKVRNKKLMIELEALKIAYSEYIKGLELSRIEIAGITNPIEYFDKPLYPLEIVHPPSYLYAFLVTLISLCLFSFSIVAKFELERLFT
jgi:capsule polysaccharide export protein KpsE/RkpR